MPSAGRKASGSIISSNSVATIRSGGDGTHEAIVSADCSLTYRELDNRANQVARYLIDQDIKSGDRVGILLRQIGPTCMWRCWR